MLYTDTRSMIWSSGRDTYFFEITIGVLQGDTLVPYRFLIYLDYVLRRALASNKELSFILNIARGIRYSDVKVADANYADDLAVLSDHLADVTKLLHHLEKATKKVGLNIS